MGATTDVLRDDSGADDASRSSSGSFTTSQQGESNPTIIEANIERTRDELCTPLFNITEKIAAMQWTLPELVFLHRELNRSMAVQCDAINAIPPLSQGRASDAA